VVSDVGEILGGQIPDDKSFEQGSIRAAVGFHRSSLSGRARCNCITPERYAIIASPLVNEPFNHYRVRYGLFTIHQCRSGAPDMNGSGESLCTGHDAQSSTGTSPSLLERIKADDRAAWERLVALYAPLVHRWCRRWGLPEQEIADVFQDIFQAVSTHIAGFRKEQEGDTFRGWLRTIAHNKVRDHFRKMGREPSGAGGTDAQVRLSLIPAGQSRDEDGSSDARTDDGLFRRALDLIRSEFEDRTWRAFWSTAVEDRGPHDVALELGMSPGAVRVAKSRVLRRLREELGEL
jgi:RNA polymerase sigma-70 factor (ECF subfamily)